MDPGWIGQRGYFSPEEPVEDEAYLPGRGRRISRETSRDPQRRRREVVWFGSLRDKHSEPEDVVLRASRPQSVCLLPRREARTEAVTEQCRLHEGGLQNHRDYGCLGQELPRRFAKGRGQGRDGTPAGAGKTIRASKSSPSRARSERHWINSLGLPKCYLLTSRPPPL